MSRGSFYLASIQAWLFLSFRRAAAFGRKEFERRDSAAASAAAPKRIRRIGSGSARPAATASA
jgi:hypothetical protein